MPQRIRPSLEVLYGPHIAKRAREMQDFVNAYGTVTAPDVRRLPHVETRTVVVETRIVEVVRLKRRTIPARVSA